MRSAFIIHRPAFTIVELVVSLGVLSILLLMAGAVFTLTLKSSGQASAIMEVSQLVRTLEQNLREDLRYVQPGQSLMAIQGNTINAYWTSAEKEVDDDGDPRTGLSLRRDPVREKVDTGGTKTVVPDLPRADILMFFTARPGASFVDPSVKGRMQQVVYGHAELGEISAATKQWRSAGFVSYGDAALGQSNLSFRMINASEGYGRYDVVATANTPRLFSSAARDWQLCRRSVLIVDAALTAPNYYPAASLNDSSTVLPGNDDEPRYASLAAANYIRDGRRDYIVDGTGFDYALDVLNRAPNPAYDNDGAANTDAVVNWMGRSHLDPDPPASEARRLGHYLMPNCASFKVEWALELDDPSGAGEIIWIDPGDFAGSLQRIYARVDQIDQDALDGKFDNSRFARALESRFTPAPGSIPGVEKLLPRVATASNPYPERFADFNGGLSADGTVRSTHIFYSSIPPRPGPGLAGTYAPDPLFPKALRITVDVYDSAGRLDRPVRHVMTIPVGGD